MRPDEIPYEDPRQAQPRSDFPAPVLPDEGLFQVVLDHPDSDAPRLILADWFDEHGQPERAEFIRVQCALARCAPAAPEWADLQTREQQLLAGSKTPWSRTRREWIAPLQGVDMGWGFRRGFVEEAELSASVFLTDAARLFQLAPVRIVCLNFMNFPANQCAALADLPQLARVTTMTLQGAECVGVLAHSPHLTSLRTLHLPGGSEKGLPGSPLLARLEGLHMPRGGMGTAGFQALLQSPGFRVAELDVRGGETFDGGPDWAENCITAPNIGEEGVILLARSPAAASLRRLDLSLNGIGAPGVQALLDSSYLSGLETLKVFEAARRLCFGTAPCSLAAEWMQALRDRFGERVSFRYY